jgi:hypothetical protein
MPDLLFGGGNDSSTTGGAPVNVPITPIAPPWMKNWKDTTTPAGAPGQLETLAANMAAGGFGTAGPDLKWLQSFYKPAQTSVYAPPVAPTARPTTSPTTKPTTPPKTYETERQRRERHGYTATSGDNGFIGYARRFGSR